MVCFLSTYFSNHLITYTLLFITSKLLPKIIQCIDQPAISTLEWVVTSCITRINWDNFFLHWLLRKTSAESQTPMYFKEGFRWCDRKCCQRNWNICIMRSELRLGSKFPFSFLWCKLCFACSIWGFRHAGRNSHRPPHSLEYCYLYILWLHSQKSI